MKMHFSSTHEVSAALESILVGRCSPRQDRLRSGCIWRFQPLTTTLRPQSPIIMFQMRPVWNSILIISFLKLASLLSVAVRLPDFSVTFL